MVRRSSRSSLSGSRRHGPEKGLSPNPARGAAQKRLWMFFQSPKRSGKSRPRSARPEFPDHHRSQTRRLPSSLRAGLTVPGRHQAEESQSAPIGSSPTIHSASSQALKRRLSINHGSDGFCDPLNERQALVRFETWVSGPDPSPSAGPILSRRRNWRSFTCSEIADPAPTRRYLVDDSLGS